MGYPPAAAAAGYWLHLYTPHCQLPLCLRWPPPLSVPPGGSPSRDGTSGTAGTVITRLLLPLLLLLVLVAVVLLALMVVVVVVVVQCYPPHTSKINSALLS